MRQRFTFLDLMVALLLGVGLMALSLCVAAESGETANRIQCAANLAQIGQAMVAYANNERNGSFPRGKWDGAGVPKPRVFSSAGAKDPFGEDGPMTDVTAAMYLLLRTTDLKPKEFICPSTKDKPLAFAAGTSAKDFSNFPNKKCLSYSICNPYPSIAAISSGFRWSVTVDRTFAIAGDKNPGGDALMHMTALSPAAELRKGNSPNHNQDGQNVLYGDGHVEFRTSPFAGRDDDNIYTYGDSGKTSGGKGVKGAPVSPSDSVLLPTARDDTPAREKEEAGLKVRSEKSTPKARSTPSFTGSVNDAIAKAPLVVQNIVKIILGDKTADVFDPGIIPGKTSYSLTYEEKDTFVIHNVVIAEDGAIIEEDVVTDPNKLPAAVTAAIKKEYPDGSVMTASNGSAGGKSFFVVEESVKQDSRTLKVTRDGTIISNLVDATGMDAKDLPGPIADAAKKSHAGGTIDTVLTMMANGKLLYIINVKVGKDEYSTEVNVDGSIRADYVVSTDVDTDHLPAAIADAVKTAHPHFSVVSATVSKENGVMLYTVILSKALEEHTMHITSDGKVVDDLTSWLQPPQ